MLYGKYDSRVRHQSAPSISERTFTDLCRDRGLPLASSTGIFPAHSASSILKTAQTPTARKLPRTGGAGGGRDKDFTSEVG